MDNTIYGRMIKKVRESKELFQKDLGLIAFGIDDQVKAQNLIKSIESGRRRIKPSEHKKLLEAFDMSEEEFTNFPQKKTLHDTPGELVEIPPEFIKLFPQIVGFINMFESAVKLGDTKTQASIMESMAERLEKIAKKIRQETNNDE